MVILFIGAKIMKKIRNIYVAFGALTAISTAANANNNVCDSLLQHGITNTIVKTTNYAYLSTVNDNYCQSDYSSLTSSKQDQFGIAVKNIPVEFKGNSNKASEQHSTFCSHYETFNTIDLNTRMNVNKIYGKAVDAWSNCVALSATGTQIEGSVSETQKSVFFDIYQTAGSAIFKGVDTTSMKCKLNDKPVSGNEKIEITSEVITLKCDRDSREIRFNDSTVEYYPAAIVNVKTNAKSYRVELIETINEPMGDRLSRIESSIAGLMVKTDDQASKYDLIGKGEKTHQQKINNPAMKNHPAFKNPNTYNCPKGHYVSGIEATRGVGGKYATDGISELLVRCTPLYGSK